jgi:predicted DNA-binding transcriptional regulator AlpA
MIPKIKTHAAQAASVTPETMPLTGYIRLNKLIKFVPLSKSSIWRLSKKDKFPRPVKITDNCTVWKCEAVHAWLNSKELSQ